MSIKNILLGSLFFGGIGAPLEYRAPEVKLPDPNIIPHNSPERVMSVNLGANMGDRWYKARKKRNKMAKQSRKINRSY